LHLLALALLFKSNQFIISEDNSPFISIQQLLESIAQYLFYFYSFTSNQFSTTTLCLQLIFFNTKSILFLVAQLLLSI